MQPQLHFHAPCFDGIASAVLAWRFLETERGWPAPKLIPVNYDRRNTWLDTVLGQPCAVVDFHYHPHTAFWADHHQTTFLTKDAAADFARRSRPNPAVPEGDRPVLMFDKEAGSCAGLLWRRLGQAFQLRNETYAELVRWAEKIDAAAYDDVMEAIEGDAPALQINGSLSIQDEDDYSCDLVRRLRESTFAAVASHPDTKRRFEAFRELSRRGIAAFDKGARLLDDTIVAFRYETREPREMIVPRYVAYLRHPEAQYSLVLASSPERVTIRANRNPWLPGPSLPLGHIFRSAGGGGHQVVGAVVLEGKATSRGDEVFDGILAELRRRIRAPISESGR